MFSYHVLVLLMDYTSCRLVFIVAIRNSAIVIIESKAWHWLISWFDKNHKLLTGRPMYPETMKVSSVMGNIRALSSTVLPLIAPNHPHVLWHFVSARGSGSIELSHHTYTEALQVIFDAFAFFLFFYRLPLPSPARSALTLFYCASLPTHLEYSAWTGMA